MATRSPKTWSWLISFKACSSTMTDIVMPAATDRLAAPAKVKQCRCERRKCQIYCRTHMSISEVTVELKNGCLEQAFFFFWLRQTFKKQQKKSVSPIPKFKDKYFVAKCSSAPSDPLTISSYTLCSIEIFAYLHTYSQWAHEWLTLLSCKNLITPFK